MLTLEQLTLTASICGLIYPFFSRSKICTYANFGTSGGKAISLTLFKIFWFSSFHDLLSVSLKPWIAYILKNYMSRPEKKSNIDKESLELIFLYKHDEMKYYLQNFGTFSLSHLTLFNYKHDMHGTCECIKNIFLNKIHCQQWLVKNCYDYLITCKKKYLKIKLLLFLLSPVSINLKIVTL